MSYCVAYVTILMVSDCSYPGLLAVLSPLTKTKSTFTFTPSSSLPKPPPVEDNVEFTTPPLFNASEGNTKQAPCNWPWRVSRVLSKCRRNRGARAESFRVAKPDICDRGLAREPKWLKENNKAALSDGRGISRGKLPISRQVFGFHAFHLTGSASLLHVIRP